MKTIIQFENPRYWENNINCPWCNTIDNLYNEAYPQDQEIIIFLDQNYLVNGYRVLSTFEKWNLKDKISLINGYNNLEYQNPTPSILYSRWCKWCGSRKPDIYEE